MKSINLLDRKESNLEKYKNDIDYLKLEKSYEELPSSYYRWLQSILHTPSIGSKPVNPYTAADIGNGIAGVGGAIVMGTDAQKKNEKWQQQVDQFNKHLAKLDSSYDQVAFLVREIHLIIDRSPTD